MKPNIGFIVKTVSTIYPRSSWVRGGYYESKQTDSPPPTKGIVIGKGRKMVLFTCELGRRKVF